MPKEQSPGKPTARRYTPEEKASAVRMVRAPRAELGTDHGTVQRVAHQLGYGIESVRSWVRQADIDDGHAPWVSTTESARVKELEQEVREPKRANEILCAEKRDMADEVCTQRSWRQMLRRSLTPAEWSRLGGMFVVIVGLHAFGWGLVYVVGSAEVGKHAFGIGLALTAYTLGLRHAFDADHIAAIDNTIRKLMHDGQRRLAVGFFFSLGHSTVVFGLAVLLGLGVKTLVGPAEDDSSRLHHYIGLIGTGVSGVFLYLIAALNVVVLVDILWIIARMRAGSYDDAELQTQLDQRGLVTRVLRRFTRSITRSWHIYPVGILFGFGFDTATEVALLVLAAGGAATGLPWYAIVCLPVLFAAGMCLLDTADGSFMNFAYGWAYSNLARKVYYNLTITALSVMVALLIGTVELLELLAERWGGAVGSRT